MLSSEGGLKLGSCLQCVWQQPMCLYLLSNLQAFISVTGTEVHQRERASTSMSWWHSDFIPPPWIGSLHVVVSCEWLVHCWYYRRQSSSLICLIHLREYCVGGETNCSHGKLEVLKIRLSPTTSLIQYRIPVAKSICSSCRGQTALSLHSTLGEGRIYGYGMGWRKDGNVIQLALESQGIEKVGTGEVWMDLIGVGFPCR